MSTDAITAAQDAPTSELVAGTVGERCPTCQTPLATDQRYCVNCGARRGKARYSADELASGAPPLEAAGAPAAPYASPRGGSGMTLIAGVATLLIAMGVGFLIGRNSNSSPSRVSDRPLVVTVGGGAASTAGGNAAAATSSASSTHAKGGKVKPVVVHLTPKATAAANQAASKVLGSGGNLSNNVAQKQGGSCTGGAGCQGHKFTGNFFGQ